MSDNALSHHTSEDLTKSELSDYSSTSDLNNASNEESELPMDIPSRATQIYNFEHLQKFLMDVFNNLVYYNVKEIANKLLHKNILRDQDTFCFLIMQEQSIKPDQTHTFAALMSIINAVLPEIGEKLLLYLMGEFKKALHQNDKSKGLINLCFLAHLINQCVVHDTLGLEVLETLTDPPSELSVSMAIEFLNDCGTKLMEVNKKGVDVVFNKLKIIREHPRRLRRKLKSMIDSMLKMNVEDFDLNPVHSLKLDFVKEEHQHTHMLMLAEGINIKYPLETFNFDRNYKENEDKYKNLIKNNLNKILKKDKTVQHKLPEANNYLKYINLIRNNIYSVIYSCFTYEECTRDLMQIKMEPGKEIDLFTAFVECCSDQRVYWGLYAKIGERICRLEMNYVKLFEEIFIDFYTKTNAKLHDFQNLHNVSKFYAHLLNADAISWNVLDCMKLHYNDSNIRKHKHAFIKLFFQELMKAMGRNTLNDKLKNDVMPQSLLGLFPRDDPAKTRYAINFFRSFGLDSITDDLRQYLKISKFEYKYDYDYESEITSSDLKSRDEEFKQLHENSKSTILPQSETKKMRMFYSSFSSSTLTSVSMDDSNYSVNEISIKCDDSSDEALIKSHDNEFSSCSYQSFDKISDSYSPLCQSETDNEETNSMGNISSPTRNALQTDSSDENDKQTISESETDNEETKSLGNKSSPTRNSFQMDSNDDNDEKPIFKKFKLELV